MIAPGRYLYEIHRGNELIATEEDRFADGELSGIRRPAGGSDVFEASAMLDPQGQAVEHALHALGFGDVARVRVGKHLVLEVTAASRDEALARARVMCDRLLANPVTEDYDLAVEAA